MKKEPVEIKCACGAHFRLWIPLKDRGEWEKGSNISCIRCGARFLVKRNPSGFEALSLREEKAAAPAPPAAATLPRPAEEAPGREAPAPHIKTKDTVLVVEDDRLARDMVLNSLRNTGYNLLSAKNGTEAMRILKTRKVDLIVSDLYLKNPEDPEATMDGEELLRRASDQGLEIPAIITTGKEIVDDLVYDPKWYDLRVKGFVQKGNPFWVDEVREKVMDVMTKD